MSFYIYHHNDFDGLASAAIFSKFITMEFDIDFSEICYKAVDYNIKDEWPHLKLNRPCATLDFLYHPETDWWFDHHSDPFLTNAVIRSPYKRNNKQYWSKKFLSCPSLLVSHFYRYYRKQSIYIKRHYQELIKWSDIIDGAQYPNAKDLYDYSNMYININKTLAVRNDQKYFNMLIESIYHNNIEKFVSSNIFVDVFSKIKKVEKKAIKVVKELIIVDGNVAFFDQSEYDFPFQRYLAYYLYPEISYRVAIFKKDKLFSLSVNYNVWKNERNPVDLGRLCKKFGGGGRNDVGGILTEKHESAIKIAKNIVNLLKESKPRQMELFSNDKANLLGLRRS